jgi:rhamnose transport system permease protein
VTAVAALGEALVILTRNVDLSVEATIGIVAYVVAVTLEGHTVAVPVAIALGIGLGLVLGIINGILVAFLRVPSIVATLGTLSVFRGVDYFIAGSHQVPLASLPDGFTDAARSDLFGIPLFVILTVALVAVGTVVLRSTRFGRQIYAVGSNPEAAAVLGIPSRLVVFAVFALCGALAGVAGVLWVMEFGTINGTAATGAVLAIVAAAVVGGVNIFGGSGTLAGAALGALFLGFVANALPLIGLNQFYLQAIYGAVILVAISTDAIIVRRLQRSRTRRSGR